jgi:hypothetical protein
MKKHVIGWTVVTLAAASALALSSPVFAQKSSRTNDQAMSSYAMAPPTGPIYSDGSVTAANWDDVVVDGAIVGRDPDPNIRFQLFREGQSWNAGDGGGGE